MIDKVEVSTTTTYFDFFSFVVYRVFHYRPNTIVIGVIFAFGLV